MDTADEWENKERTATDITSSSEIVETRTSNVRKQHGLGEKRALAQELERESNIHVQNDLSAQNSNVQCLLFF
jgi:hypothetical protein